MYFSKVKVYVCVCVCNKSLASYLVVRIFLCVEKSHRNDKHQLENEISATSQLVCASSSFRNNFSFKLSTSIQSCSKVKVFVLSLQQVH